ncbi:MAG: PilZ domain-containing protein [Candidatus Sulfotelmatobacter sp.]
MTSDMAFECLLVSHDSSFICDMQKLLDAFSISTNVYLTTSRALEQMPGHSTDLVIIDWEDESADFLNSIRKTSGWQKPTVVAVSQIDCRVPGADVTMRKPVTDANPLKLAYSRMVYDHRRHARYALMTPVTATKNNSQSMEITVLDIGDGGVGISTKHEFAVGDRLSFRLPLPETDRVVYIEARVQWTRQYGAMGCEFLRIPPVDLNILHDWLTHKSPIKKPLVSL